MAVMSGYAQHVGNGAAMPHNQDILTGPFKLIVTAVPWWLSWSHVEALMRGPLTIPQPHGRPPLVLPGVEGFQGGFCATMQDEGPMQHLDVLVVLRFATAEGAMLASQKFQNYTFHSEKAQHPPWSATEMQILRRRAVPLIPDDPLDPTLKRVHLEDQTAAEEAALAAAAAGELPPPPPPPPPPPLPPQQMPDQQQAGQSEPSDSRSKRKRRRRSKAGGKAGSKVSTATDAAADTAATATDAASAQQPPPPPDAAQPMPALPLAELPTQPLDGTPPAALPPLPTEAASDEPPLPPGESPPDAAPPPLPPPPDTAAADAGPAAEPPLPDDAAAAGDNPPSPPPPIAPDPPQPGTDGPVVLKGGHAAATGPAEAAAAETAAAAATAAEAVAAETAAAAATAAEAVAAETAAAAATAAEAVDLGHGDANRREGGSVTRHEHVGGSAKPDDGTQAGHVVIRFKSPVPCPQETAPQDSSLAKSDTAAGASARAARRSASRAQEEPAPAQKPPPPSRSGGRGEAGSGRGEGGREARQPQRKRSPARDLPPTSRSPKRVRFREGSKEYAPGGPPVLPTEPLRPAVLPPPPRGAETRSALPRGAGSTTRSGVTAIGSAASLHDSGPRKLRLDELACLVDCAHIAGPDPLKVRLPTAALEIGDPRDVAEVAAELDALNVNRRGAVRVAFSPTTTSRDAAELAAIARRLGPHGVATGTAAGAADAAWHWWVTAPGAAAGRLIGEPVLCPRGTSLIGIALPCWQGKLDGDHAVGHVRLLGPGVEVHTLPRNLPVTAKFPLDQVPAAERLAHVAASTALQPTGGASEARYFSDFVRDLRDKRGEGLVVQLNPACNAGYRKLWLLSSASGSPGNSPAPQLYVFWRQ